MNRDLAPSKIPPAQGNGTEFRPTETTFGSLPWRGPLRAPQGPHPGRPALRTAMRNLVGEPRLSESRNLLTDGSSGSRLSRPSRNFRILTDGARRPAFSWWGQLPVRPRGPKSDNFRANPTHTSNFCVPPNTRVVICLPQVGRLTSVVKNMTSDGVAFAKWILLEKPQFDFRPMGAHIRFWHVAKRGAQPPRSQLGGGPYGTLHRFRESCVAKGTRGITIQSYPT